MIRGCMLVGAVALGLPMAARADAPCRAEAQAMSGAKRDPALSPPKEPEAKAHMRAANTHSETATRLAGVVEARDQVAAEYRAAVDEYVAAVKVSASPSLPYNLAQTYRAAGDYPKAVEQYRLFLVRGEPGEPLRNLVECHIAAMTAELDRAASTAPPRGPAPMEDAPPVEPTAPAPAPTSAPAVALEPPHAPALSAPVPWHADGAGWAIAGGGRGGRRRGRVPASRRAQPARRRRRRAARRRARRHGRQGRQPAGPGVRSRPRPGWRCWRWASSSWRSRQARRATPDRARACRW
jgi:hypothetical protein